jgi:hypothetical protein
VTRSTNGETADHRDDARAILAGDLRRLLRHALAAREGLASLESARRGAPLHPAPVPGRVG